MKTLISGCFLFLLVAGCSGDDDSNTEVGQGLVAVDVYGEEFIEDGIPSDEMADGWSVTFDEFEVEATDVRVGGVAANGPFTQDISQSSAGAGHTLTMIDVPAGSHSGSTYTLTRVVASGSATKDGVTKTFEWDLSAAVTEYTACETTTVVEDGGMASFQMTVHADHLFYDSLVSEDPAVVFQSLADADADADGAITQAELEATDVGSFDIGNADVNNLWEWLLAQTATLGHVDGEGHCDAIAR